MTSTEQSAGVSNKNIDSNKKNVSTAKVNGLHPHSPDSVFAVGSSTTKDVNDQPERHLDNPGPAYGLERSEEFNIPSLQTLDNRYQNQYATSRMNGDGGESLDYSYNGETDTDSAGLPFPDNRHHTTNGGDDGSESYLAIQSLRGESNTVMTAGHVAAHQSQQQQPPKDATETVQEMHLALLYLLSNPEEFQKALAAHPARGATTLAEWNAEYDNESMTDAGSVFTANQHLQAQPSSYLNGSVTATPLPFVVFADDAEVVLPQAHTASQLFGMERIDGIELEAAAGIPAISQLFLRWLALMPGGDHLNIIDPPGLTVMRIAGGRYRVTAAHRVVWTWMNEFAPICPAPTFTSSMDGGGDMSSSPSFFDRKTGGSGGNGGPDEELDSVTESMNQLQVGDLVTMTIVDVFETDNQGKLLSYCPTFDNRAIQKTNQATETLRKSGSRVVTEIKKAGRSRLAKSMMRKAQSVALSVREMAVHQVYGTNSGSGPDGGSASPMAAGPGCGAVGTNCSDLDGQGDDPELHEI